MVTMSTGSHRSSFRITNGSYYHPTHVALKNKLQTDIRITHEGCDYLNLPPGTTIPKFFNNNLIRIPSASNQTLVHCLVNNKDRLFYIHKAERKIIEIHGVDIKSIQTLVNKDWEEAPIDYQPKPLSLEKIKSIAELIGYPALLTHATRAKNIEVKLTREQRRLVLMMMDDQNISFCNSSYTYAFQAYLAKYMHESMLEKTKLEFEERHQTESKKNNSLWQSFKHIISKTIWTSVEEKKLKIKAMQEWTIQLHRLSARFKAFDTFVNNRGPDPKQTLTQLRDIFQKYKQDIQSDLDDMIQNIPETNRKAKQKKQILMKLKHQLATDIDKFEVQLTKLDKKPTKIQIDRLVSMTDRDLHIQSLGRFMQMQMTCILQAGIQVSYKISAQRLRDVIQVPSLIAHLSDAKHLMLIKGQSIVEGPKANDTYSSIPSAMLDATTQAEIISDSRDSWFSIKPYLKKWNPASVDKILCLITGRAAIANNRHANYFYHFFVQPLKFFASIFEITFAIPRLGLVLFLGTTEALLFILTRQHKSTESKLTYQLNEWIKQFYQDYALLVAPLTYLKNSSWNAYHRENVDNNDPHQFILDACTDQSGFCHNLFVYLTPQLISETILDFFNSIFRQMLSIPRDISYLISYDQQANDTFKQIQFRHQSLEKLNELLTQKLISLKQSTEKSDSYEPLSYCIVNHISSPLDVFYEIMVTLSNSVVNPMFRKSPGIATFFFAISITTFATFILPAPTIAWLKSVPTWLKYPAEQISLHFTGKSTTLGIQEQVVACFLEWKLGFFATEFGVELAHGHFEIFESLFEDPEQIVLVLVSLISLGITLQYIPELPTTIHIPGLPEIPNYYFMIVNVFTEEAKGCKEGTVGLTSIEYGFLGLKFAMLMHSMLSGSESRQELSSLQQLVLACGQKSFFKKIIESSQEMGLSEWLKDNSFIEELNQSLSNLEPSIFASSPIEKNPRVYAFANMLTRIINQTLAEQNLQFEKQELLLFKTALAKQLLTLPEFLSINQAKDKYLKTLTRAPDDEKRTKLNFQSPPKTILNLQEAYQALQEAIMITNNPEQPLIFINQRFGLIKEANQYYDYLDRCFENYNQALKQEYGTNNENYETLYLDKRPYLDVFFNKYCYEPSNNFMRSLIFFIYPLSLLSRGLKFLWATIMHKPCMQHQIIKNFCKDMVIVSQIIGPIARMTADFNLYITGVLRGLAFVVTLPTTLAIYPIFYVMAKVMDKFFHTGANIAPLSHWFEFLDDWICYLIALHETKDLSLIRQLFVRASRVAGTNQDIGHATDKMCQDLDQIAKLIPSLRFSPNCTEIHKSLQTKLSTAMDEPYWSEENVLPNLFAEYTPLETQYIAKDIIDNSQSYRSNP